VSESIKVHQKTLEELNLNAQNAVGQIRTAFAKARANLDKRENELLGETEAVRLQKEKELKLQKEGLEMFGEGMRSAAHFTKTLLTKGSQVEVAMSKKAVLGRLITLNQAKLELTPCHDSLLRFNEAGLETMTRATSQFGAMSSNQTSHITSYVDRQGRQSSGAVSLNEDVSFPIISMNKEGERIQRGGDSYVMHVEGPSKVEVNEERLLTFLFIVGLISDLMNKIASSC